MEDSKDMGASASPTALSAPAADAASAPIAGADALLSCGHPASLLLKSAETGLPLYCELCDAQSGRRDAEAMEQQMRTEKRAALDWVRRMGAETGHFVNAEACADFTDQLAAQLSLARGIKPEGRESAGPSAKRAEPGPEGAPK